MWYIVLVLLLRRREAIRLYVYEENALWADEKTAQAQEVEHRSEELRFRSMGSQQSQQQYSLASVFKDRALGDVRRTKDPRRADLFLVPLDIQKYKLEAMALQKNKPDHFCQRIGAVRTLLTQNRWYKSTNHIASIARVAPSLVFEWGKACFETLEWLRTSMQWLSIEQPFFFLSRQNKAAHADTPIIRKSFSQYPQARVKFRNGSGFLYQLVGLDSHHTLPYPTGLRLKSNAEFSALKKFHYTNRNMLIAQSIGDHRRHGSQLRAVLKAECTRQGPAVCASDWKIFRDRFLRRSLLASNEFNIAHHIAKAAPYFPLYSTATFCLQPFGVTPSRNGIYECLLAGTIPVFFEPYIIEALGPLFDFVTKDEITAPYTFRPLQPFSTEGLRGTRFQLSAWAVLIDAESVIQDAATNLYQVLRTIPQSTISQMQNTISKCTARFQYSLPTANLTEPDAFDFAITRAFTLTQRERRHLHHPHFSRRQDGAFYEGNTDFYNEAVREAPLTSDKLRPIDPLANY